MLDQDTICCKCRHRAVIEIREHLIYIQLCENCADKYADELRGRLAAVTRALREFRMLHPGELVHDPQTS